MVMTSRGIGSVSRSLVVEAPPCRRVAAERLAGIFWIGAGPRRDIDDPQLNHITLLGAADVDRSSEDMDAHAFAGTATEQRSIHRPCATPVDALLLLGPQEDALGTEIALDHALGVIIGMVGQRLDGDEVT